MNTENTKTEATEEVVKETAQTTEEKNVLLGTISYTNQDDYEKFLSKLDVNQAIFVLIASANYGQAKGLFNLDESELIAKAIKTIKRTTSNVTSEDTKE
jgi:hypothetical protein